MRQPRRGITSTIKAMTPATVPPMTAPASTEEVASPVMNRIVGTEHSLSQLRGIIILCIYTEKLNNQTYLLQQYCPDQAVRYLVSQPVNKNISDIMAHTNQQLHGTGTSGMHSATQIDKVYHRRV